MSPDFNTLHQLYVVERLTVREIAKRLGFASKTSIQNRLKAFGIPRRDGHNGLLNRGIEPPSREVLQHLVHVEHKGYREIAKMYNVDFTAVPYWLKIHQIELPTVWGTRRKGVQPILPAEDELRHMYLDQCMVLDDIAAKYEVSEFLIKSLCKKFSIPMRPDGFNGGIRFTCDDGHLARSTYEQKVDNWLYEHGIAHEYEPRLPFGPHWYADFLANSWYIEIWGVKNSKEYTQRKARKLALYHVHQTPLIQLSVDSFQPRRKDGWKRSLQRLLQ